MGEKICTFNVYKGRKIIKEVRKRTGMETCKNEIKEEPPNGQGKEQTL